MSFNREVFQHSTYSTYAAGISGDLSSGETSNAEGFQMGQSGTNRNQQRGPPTVDENIITIDSSSDDDDDDDDDDNNAMETAGMSHLDNNQLDMLLSEKEIKHEELKMKLFDHLVKTDLQKKELKRCKKEIELLKLIKALRRLRAIRNLAS